MGIEIFIQDFCRLLVEVSSLPPSERGRKTTDIHAACLGAVGGGPTAMRSCVQLWNARADEHMQSHGRKLFTGMSTEGVGGHILL